MDKRKKKRVEKRKKENRPYLFFKLWWNSTSSSSLFSSHSQLPFRSVDDNFMRLIRTGEEDVLDLDRESLQLSTLGIKGSFPFLFLGVAVDVEDVAGVADPKKLGGLSWLYMLSSCPSSDSSDSPSSLASNPSINSASPSCSISLVACGPHVAEIRMEEKASAANPAQPPMNTPQQMAATQNMMTGYSTCNTCKNRSKGLVTN